MKANMRVFVVLAAAALLASAGRVLVEARDAKESRGHHAVQQTDKIKLQLGGRAGDTYATEYTITTKVEPLDQSEEVTAATTKTQVMRMWIETSIKEIKPRGRVVINQKVKRFALSVTRAGETTSLDSDDPSIREEAKQNPDLAALLKLLDATIEEELEPTGEVRKFAVVGTDDPSVRSLLEDEISQPLAMLPDQAVAVLDKWDCGSQSMSFPGFGGGKVKLEGVLLDVKAEGDSKTAQVGVRGEMAWATDPDSKAKIELQDFKLGGLCAFSCGKGRFVSGYRLAEATLLCTDQNGSVKLKATSELRAEEVER